MEQSAAIAADADCVLLFAAASYPLVRRLQLRPDLHGAEALLADGTVLLTNITRLRGAAPAFACTVVLRPGADATDRDLELAARGAWPQLRTLLHLSGRFPEEP